MPVMKKVLRVVAVSVVAALAVAMAGAIAVGDYTTFGFLLSVALPFGAAGIFLFWRHPDDPVARLLLIGSAAALAYPGLLERLVLDRYAVAGEQGWMAPALLAESLVFTAGVACLAAVLGLLPTGRAETRGEERFVRVLRWLPAAMAVATLASPVVLVEPLAYGDLPPFRNPLHVPALDWLSPVAAQARNLVSTSAFVGLMVLLARYRRGTPARRRRLRWVLFGVTLSLAAGAAPVVLGPLLGTGTPAHESLVLALGSVALILIPASIVLTVEQPPWIDADDLIRKSLVYGSLSLGIFVVYAALAAGLGLAAGARLPVEAAIVVTAVVAFVFQPTRRRLQVVADRWVFGERPTPFEAISGLEGGVEGGATADEVGRRLAELVRSAARLRWVAVTIPPGPGRVAGDRQGEPVRTVTIERRGERFGTILCGPRIGGAFTAREDQLVEALAAQAALLVANLRLAGRIVGAQEAERRRIERNIHDGAQQEIVALVAKLGLARTQARRGPVPEETLAELQDDARAILRDLRDLAQGIHPSVLTDGGIVEAVEDRCSRLPIDVTVEVSPELRRQRFGDDVEGAAYFFVAESLANVLKHASAGHAKVAVRRRGDELELTVGDDGSGFDPAAIRHNGLAGLSDRFAALAGSVRIDARPGSGTVLSARLPLREDAS